METILEPCHYCGYQFPLSEEGKKWQKIHYQQLRDLQTGIEYQSKEQEKQL
jgi:hypothetical protein